MGHQTEKMVLETYGHLRPNWATQEVLDKAPRLGIFKSRGGKGTATETVLGFTCTDADNGDSSKHGRRPGSSLVATA